MVKKTAKKKAKPKAGEPLVTTGKRKSAVARALVRPGNGVVKINAIPLDLWEPDVVRLKISEPLLILGDAWKQYDIRVTVRGGGIMGQAEAARQAIAKGLADVLGAEARKAFLAYDRNLLVYDPRRPEPRKPPHSSWGARRYKQRSKR